MTTTRRYMVDVPGPECDEFIEAVQTFAPNAVLYRVARLETHTPRKPGRVGHVKVGSRSVLKMRRCPWSHAVNTRMFDAYECLLSKFGDNEVSRDDMAGHVSATLLVAWGMASNTVGDLIKYSYIKVIKRGGRS